MNRVKLNEAVKVDYITNAIENRFVVNIYYAGDNTTNKGYRDVEIHKYGLTNSGNEAISAWQRKGASDTPDNLPGWRLFLVDNIKNWAVKSERFDAPRQGYNPSTTRDGILSKIFMTVLDGDSLQKPEPETTQQPEPAQQPQDKVKTIQKPEPETTQQPEPNQEPNTDTIDYEDELGRLNEIITNYKKILLCQKNH